MEFQKDRELCKSRFEENFPNDERQQAIDSRSADTKQEEQKENQPSVYHRKTAKNKRQTKPLKVASRKTIHMKILLTF